jgi:hypothetical protein
MSIRDSSLGLTACHNQLLWFVSNGLLPRWEQRVETSQLTSYAPPALVYASPALDLGIAIFSGCNLAAIFSGCNLAAIFSHCNLLSLQSSLAA